MLKEVHFRVSKRDILTLNWFLPPNFSIPLMSVVFVVCVQFHKSNRRAFNVYSPSSQILHEAAVAEVVRNHIQRCIDGFPSDTKILVIQVLPLKYRFLTISFWKLHKIDISQFSKHVTTHCNARGCVEQHNEWIQWTAFIEVHKTHFWEKEKSLSLYCYGFHISQNPPPYLAIFSVHRELKELSWWNKISRTIHFSKATCSNSFSTKKRFSDFISHYTWSQASRTEREGEVRGEGINASF